jgi:hypothetical protein
MSTDVLQKANKILESLVTSYYQANIAIKDQDDRRAHHQIDVSRRLRSHFAQIQPTLRQISSIESDAERSSWLLLKQLTEAVRTLEPAVQRWVSRPIVSRNESGETLWASQLSDAFLPLVWEYELDLVLLCGPGLSSVAKELTRRGQRRVIVYTAPDEGDEYSGELVVHSKEELRSALRSFSSMPPQRVAVPPLQGNFGLESGEQNEEALHALVKIAEESFDTMQVERNTIQAFGTLWVNQALENIAKIALRPSIHHLRGAFEKTPMVIIAPGPSLQKNAHLLMQLKGKAILVAFSHTLSALKKLGVAPDVVIALDSQDLRYHFDDYPVHEVEAVMLGITAHPSLYQLPAKRIFTFAGNTNLDWWLFSALGEEMRAPSGGSVAHTALSMGLQWGCDPIMFVGQDLAFSQDGFMYTKESSDGQAKIEVNQDNFQLKGFSDGYRKLASIKGQEKTPTSRLLEVPGYYGGMVQTSFSFFLFKRWFEEVAARVSGNVRLWNCTEGGARIEGMQQLSLAQAIESLAGVPGAAVAETLQETSARFDYPARRKMLLRHVERMLSLIETCEQRAKQCIRLVSSSGRSLKDLSALSNAEASLTEALQGATFLSYVVQGQVEESLRGLTMLDNLKECNSSAKALYESVLRACSLLRPRTKSALQRLKEFNQA